MKIEDIIDLRKSIMKLYIASLDDSKNRINPSFQNDVTELFDDIIIKEFKTSSNSGSSDKFPPVYRRMDEMAGITTLLK
jgi:hypothetical protein